MHNLCYKGVQEYSHEPINKGADRNALIEWESAGFLFKIEKN